MAQEVGGYGYFSGFFQAKSIHIHQLIVARNVLVECCLHVAFYTVSNLLRMLSDLSRALVSPGFDNEAPGSSAAKGGKRLQEDTVAVSIAKRQRAWLCRSDTVRKAWRPIHVHRQGGKGVLSDMDLQFAVMTGHAGIIFFVFTESSALWANCFSWPYLVVNQDMASDNLTAYQALERRFKANTDLFGDPVHGGHRDFDLTLGQCQVKNVFLLCVIGMNLLFGPDRDEQRFHQIRCCMEALHKGKRLEELPLLQSYASLIFADLRRMGIELPGLESDDEEVKNWMQQRGFAVREHRRITLCRFMAGVAGAEFHVQKWNIDAYETLCLALECDFLKSRKLDKLILRTGDAEKIGEHSGSTSATRMSVEDRSLRDCAENAVVIKTLMWSDQGNRRILEIITSVGCPLKRWIGATSRACRSTDSSLPYWKDQIGSKYMEHVKEIASVWQSCNVLECCQFILREVDYAAQDCLEVKTEDEYADMLGQCSMTLAANRMRRGLHLFGWPFRFAKCLQSTELAVTTIKLFRRDEEAMTRFAAIPHTTTQKLIAKRNVFVKLSIDQMSQCLTATADRPTPELLSLIEKRTSLMLGSLMCEEMIGSQKNNKEVKMGRKFRKPEYSFAAPIRTEVLQTRNHFKTISLDMPLDSHTERLADDCFYPNASKRSLPFQEIATTSQAPDYYSPSAQNVNCPHADTIMLRELPPPSFL